jgi:hypothetical protein
MLDYLIFTIFLFSWMAVSATSANTPGNLQA